MKGGGRLKKEKGRHGDGETERNREWETRRNGEERN